MPTREPTQARGRAASPRPPVPAQSHAWQPCIQSGARTTSWAEAEEAAPASQGPSCTALYIHPILPSLQ